MKRKFFIIGILILGLLSLIYLQFLRMPCINNITSIKGPHGYEASISITANQLVIFNQEHLKNELIQQILENDFENMQISDELLCGPTKFHVTVYTSSFTRYLDISACDFEYLIKTDL